MNLIHDLLFISLILCRRWNPVRDKSKGSGIRDSLVGTSGLGTI